MIIRKAQLDDAICVHAIQVKSFLPLLEYYKDYELSPACESLESLKLKMKRENTSPYCFEIEGKVIGWVRVTAFDQDIYKISSLCIAPEHQGKGYAQEALLEIEKRHPQAQKWVLSTILEERRNCYLYEKLGYKKVGDLIKVNPRMTLVNYEKEGGPK